jgi:hypothetical protein
MENMALGMTLPFLVLLLYYMMLTETGETMLGPATSLISP